jgi:flagellar protein FliS
MLEAYRQNNALNAEYADPHQLIGMLFDGVMERLSRAIGHIERGELAAKGECLSRAVSIIATLQDSLDHDVGGELSLNLEALYDFMIRHLTEANLHNDIERVREVQSLIEPLREAWKEIGPQVRDPAVAGPQTA